MVVNKPPMGWNSWNTFGAAVNEETVIETVDALVEKGFRDAGYEYVVIDDCWMARERDENGDLVADPEKFPHGMKYVGDYIHSKGMKFGIYSSASPLTCQTRPASYGHEYRDAKKFAEWGVDYLKYDLCFFPGKGDYRNAYLTMGMALRASGRDILYALCPIGIGEPEKWARAVGGHMYRSTVDIFDSFESMKSNVQNQLYKMHYSAPGCFNDIDMLIVGMHGKGNVGDLFGLGSGCTDEEYSMHFAYWCLFGSPLMIGCDVRNVDEHCLKTMLNKDLIAINQDAEARPMYFDERARLFDDNKIGCIKLLEDNKAVIGFFNFSDVRSTICACFEDFGIASESGYGLELTDIISGENIGKKFDTLCETLEPHTFKVFKAEFCTRK